MTVPNESHDIEVRLLDADELDSTIDAELARAARHELPLSLVLLEVSGPSMRDGSDSNSRISQAVVAALRERIRAEDFTAWLGPLKFAVLAVETAESEALAGSLADHVRKALARLGADGHGLSVTTGAADCQYDELTRQELLEAADRALSAAGHTGFLRKSA